MNLPHNAAQSAAGISENMQRNPQTAAALFGKSPASFNTVLINFPSLIPPKNFGIRGKSVSLPHNERVDSPHRKSSADERLRHCAQLRRICDLSPAGQMGGRTEFLPPSRPDRRVQSAFAAQRRPARAVLYEFLRHLLPRCPQARAPRRKGTEGKTLLRGENRLPLAGHAAPLARRELPLHALHRRGQLARALRPGRTPHTPLAHGRSGNAGSRRAAAKWRRSMRR